MWQTEYKDVSMSSDLLRLLLILFRLISFIFTVFFSFQLLSSSTLFSTIRPSFALSLFSCHQINQSISWISYVSSADLWMFQLQKMKQLRAVYPEKKVYTQQVGPGCCFGALALMLRFYFEVIIVKIKIILTSWLSSVSCPKAIFSLIYINPVFSSL